MRFLIVLAICLAWVFPASAASQRHALVIGNDSYTQVAALDKAANDARAMSSALTELGFRVQTLIDGTRRAMNLEISAFTARLQPGDTALVFYAGHGVQIEGENYLLPIDIEASSATGEDFVRYESIGLSDLLARIERTGARTTLVFLDACRDNPFAAKTGRALGGIRGLARIAAPQGTFVVYSASAQQQALDSLAKDDADDNSVFTRLLLPKLKTPGLELRELVLQLRREVRDLARTVGHDQFPAYYDELLGQFYFAPEADPVAVAATAPVSQAEVEAARPAPAAAPELAASAAPPPQPQEVAVPTREILRQTQVALNAAGCDAGSPDGIAGPRTRRALSEFAARSGLTIAPEALGSEAALAAIRSVNGQTVCPVATPRASEQAPSTQNAATPAQAAPKAPSIAGTWSLSAKCPLFISTTGSLRYRAAGGSSYTTSLRDSLGQSSTGTARLNGRSVSGTHNWSHGQRTTFTATVSSNFRSMSGRDSVGCRFTANRTN